LSHASEAVDVVSRHGIAFARQTLHSQDSRGETTGRGRGSKEAKSGRGRSAIGAGGADSRSQPPQFRTSTKHGDPGAKRCRGEGGIGHSSLYAWSGLTCFGTASWAGMLWCGRLHVGVLTQGFAASSSRYPYDVVSIRLIWVQYAALLGTRSAVIALWAGAAEPETRKRAGEARTGHGRGLAGVRTAMQTERGGNQHGRSRGPRKRPKSRDAGRISEQVKKQDLP
jgi:hypothetical protein